MQTLTLTDGFSDTVVAQIQDASGNPGQYSPVPSWASSNTSVAVVVNVSADGNTATVQAVAPGTCTVAQSFTSGAGNFSTPFTVTVQGGPGVSSFYTFGTPFATPSASASPSAQVASKS